MRKFLQELREAAGAQLWSRGVELARDSALFADGENYLLSGKIFSQRIKLWPDNDDWFCDCAGDDPCEHVIAAAITMHQHQLQGQPLLPSEQALGRLIYCWRLRGTQAYLDRLWEKDKQEVRVNRGLLQQESGVLRGLQPSQADLRFEAKFLEILGMSLSTWQCKQVLQFLSGEDYTSQVYIEDERGRAPVQCSNQTPSSRALLRDRGAGVWLELENTQASHFGDNLLTSESKLYPREKLHPRWKWLESGRYFPLNEFFTLASEIIPQLPVPLHSESRQFNLGKNLKPYIFWEHEPLGTGLKLRGQIVYGNPPCARLIDNELSAWGPSKVIPQRDLTTEKKLQTTLDQYDLDLDSSLRLSGSAAVEFLENVEGSLSPEPYLAAFKRQEVKPGVRLEPNANGFCLELETAAGEKVSVDPSQALRAWTMGESLVPLLDNQAWVPLPQDFLNRSADRLAALWAACAETKSLPESLLPSLQELEDCNISWQNHSSTDWRDKVKSLNLSPTELLESCDVLAPGLRAELRPYQKEGVAWLRQRGSLGFGLLLADDMGLGKTIQVLATLNAGQRNLLLLPTTVLQNWARELSKFRPDLSIRVYHGPNREWGLSQDVLLSTYTLFRLEYQQRFAECEWDCLVLDEAQLIKNPASQLAQKICLLKAKRKVALSGTPVENSLLDIWSLFRFLNPGLLGEARAFKERYQNAIQAGDESRRKELQNRLRPFVLRRSKGQVLKQLPPRTDTVLHCTLSESERELYQSLLFANRQEIQSQLRQRQGNAFFKALELLLRLRQAACHPALLPGQEVEDSAKLQELCEALDKCIANSRQSLVFSQWTGFLDLIGNALNKRDIPYLRIDGSTLKRQEIVDQFQAGDVPVLLLSLKAAGLGLNLTAASNVFITDPWWNPAAEDQAADRAHRIGQTQAVLLTRLVAVDTVEEKILELQAVKKNLAAGIFSSQEELAKRLNYEDLLSLLDD